MRYAVFNAFGRKGIPEDNEEPETEVIPERNFAIDDISD